MGNVVLGLLVMLGPQTVYDLNKQFEAGISLFYRASLGGLSNAMGGLLAKGFVSFDETVENGRSKKIYAVTPTGSAAFFAWLAEPITGGNLETVALSKLYFLGLVSETADRRAILADIVARIEQDEAELDGLASQLDGLDIPPEYAAIFRYQRQTLDYGLGSHRFGREWFQALLDREASD